MEENEKKETGTRRDGGAKSDAKKPEAKKPEPLVGIFTIVGINFHRAGKIYYFSPGKEVYEVGDRVIVESAGRTVLSAALLVYLAPLVLFFAGWAVGSAVGLPGWAAACCSLGFLLGIVPAVCYNRYLTRKKPVQYTITALSQA